MQTEITVYDKVYSRDATIEGVKRVFQHQMMYMEQPNEPVPRGFQLGIREGATPLKAGKYILSPESFEPNKYGGLALGYEPVLIPVAASK